MLAGIKLSNLLAKGSENGASTEPRLYRHDAGKGR
jgi:hypothetical protein